MKIDFLWSDYAKTVIDETIGGNLYSFGYSGFKTKGDD